MFGAMLVGAVCVALACALRQNRLLLAVAGDDDMKIAAPGGFSKNTRPEDSSELAAKEFLDLKRSGDIDKARGLGERYAAMLLEKGREICALTRDSEVSLRAHQQLVLCSYTINRVISEHSPNSILAQTALNVFYSRLEEDSPELYRHISDMAAFSLYILCERSHTCSDDSGVGGVYARLCGSGDDAQIIAEGGALYRKLYDCFFEEHQKTAYSAAQ